MLLPGKGHVEPERISLVDSNFAGRHFKGSFAALADLIGRPVVSQDAILSQDEPPRLPAWQQNTKEDEEFDDDNCHGQG